MTSSADLMNELSLLHRLEKHARSLIEDEHLNVGLNDAWGLIETIEALDKLRIAQAATLIQRVEEALAAWEGKES